MKGDSVAQCQVVVVDDDLLCRHSISLLLESVGIRSIPSPTVSSEWLDELPHPPCLAIVDWNLKSSVGGRECVSMLRHRYPNLSILMLTGDTSRETREFIRESGCQYLSKPARPDTILDEVRKLLQGCPLRRRALSAGHRAATIVRSDISQCLAPCRATRTVGAAIRRTGDAGRVATFPA